jgi:hypothetical protein
MLQDIKTYLNYEIKENMNEYKDRLLDNILDEEEDLNYYCSILTGYKSFSEEDAIDSIKNWIKSMNIEEVFLKMLQRGMIVTDIEVETDNGIFYISTDIYSPLDLFYKTKEVEDIEEFLRLLTKLEESKEYPSDTLSFQYES